MCASVQCFVYHVMTQSLAAPAETIDSMIEETLLLVCVDIGRLRVSHPISVCPEPRQRAEETPCQVLVILP
jgi:hypothetical protein